MQQSKSNAGYSLIEVIIAMAILSSVILSVFALFVFGTRNVYSGKQQTQANAIGMRAMEDLSQLSKDNLYAAFGIVPGTSVLSTVDAVPGKNVPNDTYDNAILRSTNDITAGTDAKGFLQRWRDEFELENKLGKGAVHLVIMPVNRDTAGGAVTETPAVDGEVLRLRVIVSWAEGLRERTAIFDTVKFDL